MQKKKVLFHQDIPLCHKSLATMAKLAPYSQDLASSDYYLFADPKKKLAGKRFGSKEEVIAVTEAYVEAKDQAFYKRKIKMLESLD